MKRRDFFRSLAAAGLLALASSSGLASIPEQPKRTPRLEAKELLEAGYIYSPYIPLQYTPIIGVDDLYRRSTLKLAERYGRKLVNSNFYSTITITRDGVIYDRKPSLLYRLRSWFRRAA